MQARIFPKQLDNIYRGHWLGLVLFTLIIAVKALQGFESIVSTERTMVQADGIPLDKFGALAASEAVLMFALLGMYLLIVPVIGAIALVRYRAMIPFLLLMLSVVQLGARAIHWLHPTLLETTGSPAPIGFYVNLGILAVTALAFVLSVWAPATRSTVRG